MLFQIIPNCSTLNSQLHTFLFIYCDIFFLAGPTRDALKQRCAIFRVFFFLVLSLVCPQQLQSVIPCCSTHRRQYVLCFFHAKLTVDANFVVFCFFIKSYRVVWQNQVKTVPCLSGKNTKQENLFPHRKTHHLTNIEVRGPDTELN